MLDLNKHDDPDNEIYRYFSADLFTAEMPENGYLLDSGAGNGAVAFHIARHKPCRIVCLDQNQERLDNIEATRGDLAIETSFGDVNELPYDDGTFDGVYCRMVLSHQQDWMATVREMLRVCRPGGPVVFQHASKDRYEFMHARSVDDATRKRVERRAPRPGRTRASHDEIRALATEAGATVERLMPLTFFLATGLAYRARMTPEEIEQCTKELRAFLAEPRVYEFARWFERTVVPRLPQEFSEMLFAVLRKPQTPVGS